MKDYLQLDGLAYKLVPIKTKNRSAFELGRIDTELMYDVVMGWEWGNSGSDKIYHDPQTRTQGLSFRSNLARLTEKLIEEGKIDKAKDVIELAMTNMPIKHYGFYTFVEPFMDSYYKVGETEKAREVFAELKKIYQERLTYYAGISLDEQYNSIDEIISDMEAYRRIIDITIEHDTRDVSEKETLIFNEYIEKFRHFYQDDEFLEDEPALEDPDMIDTVPLIDSAESSAQTQESISETDSTE